MYNLGYAGFAIVYRVKLILKVMIDPCFVSTEKTNIDL